MCTFLTRYSLFIELLQLVCKLFNKNTETKSTQANIYNIHIILFKKHNIEVEIYFLGYLMIYQQQMYHSNYY